MSLSRRNFVARVCPTPIVALVSVGAITMAGPSLAQDGTESSAEVVTALDEVLVTARRREENLMTVPIAVTALSAAALEERNIDDMMGVANFTPGLHFTDESVSSSSGRNDRTIFSPIIRGNSLHRGTVFIDGTPVASNSPPPFADVARIEVLKGPQAVYFGRSTYTGAINFITRDPSATFGGRVSGEYGSYGSNKAALSVEGPIVDDRLTARMTASHDFKGGHYKNQTTGGRLGDRQSDSVSLSLVYEPTEQLRIRSWTGWSKDNDGVAASAVLRGDAAGDFLPNQLNCNLGGSRGAWYCGTLPDWDELPYGTISAADHFTPFLYEQLIENPAGFYTVFDSRFLTDFGLKRHNLQTNLRADYEMSGGYVLSFLGGYHRDKLMFITDVTMVDGRYYENPNFGSAPGILPYPTWIFNEQQESSDFSLEARVTSPTAERLRWTLGVSYLQAESEGSTFTLKPTGVGPSRGPSKSHPSTLGVFGGIYYDVTRDFTVTLEARYQQDDIKVDQIGGNEGFAYPDGPIRLGGKFTHIAPRVSLDYRFSDNSMVYALFSQGFRPGGFNAELRTLTPFVMDQVRKASGVGLTYGEEQLDNYEIGLKTTFLDGRARATVAAYYNEITDGQTRDTIPVVTDAGVATTVGLTANIGVIDLRGIEIEGEFRVSRELRVGATANFVDTEVKNFYCSDCVAIYGSPDATGNELQQTVKSKYVIYADYTKPAPLFDWYVRGDYSYRDGYWITTANRAKTPSESLLGLRVGIQVGALGIEAYGTNLLYDKGLRGSPGLDTVSSAFGLGFPNEVRLSLPDKRTFGIKASYEF